MHHVEATAISTTTITTRVGSLTENSANIV